MTRSRAATSIQSSARSGERRQAAAPRANAPRLSKRAQERALREQRAAAAAQRPEAGIMGMLQPLLLRVRQPPPAGALTRHRPAVTARAVSLVANDPPVGPAERRAAARRRRSTGRHAPRPGQGGPSTALPPCWGPLPPLPGIGVALTHDAAVCTLSIATCSVSSIRTATVRSSRAS